MTAPTSPRVFFYVQHLLGIGHLARASRIANALVNDGFHVTLVTGGLPVAGFPCPGIDHVALPAMAVSDGDFSALVDAAGRPVDDAFRARRQADLLAAFRDATPDVVLIEAYPFGRRQVRFELRALIDAIEGTTPRPLLMTSLRDILQRRSKPARDEETVAVIRRHFDGVLVHGDQDFARLDDTFPLASDIADRIHYTGLVCGPAPVPAPDRYEIVVSAGGGAVGAGVVAAALDAARLLPEIASWCVIAGPNMPQGDFDRFRASAPEQVSLVRFRTDFPGLLVNAKVSVSQAGYNTVGDILQAGCRALLIPYCAGGETEQSDRAARLQQIGRATVLAEADLTGDGLAQAIQRSLAQAPVRDAPSLATQGAARTAGILRTLLAASPTRSSAR
ncbi:glycosyl transferase [Pseudooceanicola sediminis]|uniref:Glycosyl transferase n=1 Tax=Pseudooceanicola sediminis TaxID=2211117 RepID=A0A399IY51_9RHOB|nr:glycosyltransferase [Pseudooceanicola sediminis]RII37900.1 glycosyl transferase [Pseudooceanicola sediminis]|tara:strand:+ start:18025 stop:19197 length:1173 start_codon:yes stop_codon:yes gene_type:complete